MDRRPSPINLNAMGLGAEWQHKTLEVEVMAQRQREAARQDADMLRAIVSDVVSQCRAEGRIKLSSVDLDEDEAEAGETIDIVTVPTIYEIDSILTAVSYRVYCYSDPSPDGLTTNVFIQRRCVDFDDATILNGNCRLISIAAINDVDVIVTDCVHGPEPTETTNNTIAIADFAERLAQYFDSRLPLAE